MPDLYQTLGVARDASLEDIRRSYKDLAKTHHPDRGGNPEKFKAIQNAYEVLSNEERRQMYNMTGSDQEQPMQRGGMAAGGIPFQFSGFGGSGFPGMSFDMSEVFGNLFGGAQKQRRGGKGPNKYHDVGLRLVDFYKGHEIKLKFNQARKCLACYGTGSESSESCGPCGGSGVRTMMRQIGPGMIAQTRAACDICSGEGKRQIKQCQRCHGKKMTEREKMLEIQVRPGHRDGDQLTYPGECSDSLEFDSPGDVILTLKRVDEKDEILDNYMWKNDDLIVRKQITYAESILGFQITLDDHPSGLSPVFRWRSGPILHGVMLHFPGQGMPKKDGSKGKLYIQIMITPPEPKEWSAEDAAKLQSIFGGSASVFEATDVQTLQLDSPDSKLQV